MAGRRRTPRSSAGSAISPARGGTVKAWLRDQHAAFDAAAWAYMQPLTERAIADAVDKSILAEVKRATSLRATFWPSVVSGVVASVVFALLVLLGAWIAKMDPSLIGTVKELLNPPTPPR